MRSIVKFSLLVLMGLVATEASFNQSAIAGRAPITNPDSSSSGLGDNFGPDATDRPPTTIETEAIKTLQSFLRNSSVPSIDGQRVSISPEQVAAIQASLLANRNSDLGPSLTQLEQQLASELSGRGLEVSRVSNSPSDVKAAVQSINDIILSLDSQQLASAIESPTFMSLLRLLSDANTLINSDPSIAFDEGDGEFGLLKLSPIRENDLEPAVILDEEDEEANQVDNQTIVQPVTPAVNEPVRGLW